MTLSGEPKSTQHIYRATCHGRFPSTYMTPEGKAIKLGYQLEAKNQYRGKLLTEELSLTIRFFFKTMGQPPSHHHCPLWNWTARVPPAVRVDASACSLASAAGASS